MNNNSTPRFGVPLFLWLAYVAFVVYGSLVPLQYKAVPLAEALAAFKNIRYLELGVESRADWVANGVLYVPVAFLTVYLLVHWLPRVPRVFSFVLAFVFSVGLAIGVEFAQLYFPQRTVSLNDVIAECLGSALGLATAVKYATWVDALLHSFLTDPRRLKRLALDGYVFIYIAFSFFPYDLLLSGAEISAKLASNNWGWLLAGSSPRPVLTGIQLIVEVILTLPIGLFLAHRAGKSRGGFGQALLMGLLLGGFIEVAQLFIASGVSQGLSVLTRAAGVCIGAALSRYGDRLTLSLMAAQVKRLTLALMAAYLLALLEINRWFTSNWQPLSAANAQWDELHFMPFYYHYYTTEAIALFSLGVVSLSYVPMGLLTWAHGRGPALAASVSLVMAFCIEFGKLFIQGAHPDPTNILLAGMASAFTVSVLRQLSTPSPSQVAPGLVVPARYQFEQSVKTPWPWPMVYVVGIAIWLVTFPAFPWLVGLVLLGCAALVWNRPLWIFAVIPAALPVFDLAPWSGRYFLDEFDALLLICLAVAFARAPAQSTRRTRPNLRLALVAGLVGLSFFVSAVLGLWPFTLPDANSFNNDYSPFNALRIFKGAFWAALVFALSRRFTDQGADPRHPFAWGMVVGLALTVAVVVWERLAFSQLWNFSDGYRVTGPFSATHTGGAYVDCFIAAAIPFLLALTLEKRHWLIKLACVALSLAATYALMVTFSRAGYLAFAVAVVAVVLALAAKSLQAKQKLVQTALLVACLTVGMLLVAVPIIKSDFAQSRAADASADLGFRQAHWQDALNIRDPSWATTLFGMGLGRFPDTNYWRSTLDAKPGTYRLQTESGNTYLRLDAGDSIGVEQFVSLEPGQRYVIKMDVRPSRPGSKMTVPVCEKWLLTSANCVTPTLDLGQGYGKWRTVELPMVADGLSAGLGYLQRPVKLALTYGVPQSTIDIDNVRLENESKRNLLRNGDFTQGLDNWFFSTAGTLHAHWRVHSLYYGLLFDQGWFGLMTMGLLFAIALVRAARNAWRTDTIAGAGLAALLGFLVGGVFDNPLDAPRFLMLLLMLTWVCALQTKRTELSVREG